MIDRKFQFIFSTHSCESDTKLSNVHVSIHHLPNHQLSHNILINKCNIHISGKHLIWSCTPSQCLSLMPHMVFKNGTSRKRIPRRTDKQVSRSMWIIAPR